MKVPPLSDLISELVYDRQETIHDIVSVLGRDGIPPEEANYLLMFVIALNIAELKLDLVTEGRNLLAVLMEVHRSAKKFNKEDSK
jgi:hypothetical protein